MSSVVSEIEGLPEFFAARLDEHEAAARESFYDGQRWLTEEEGVYRWPDDELVHMADRKADARHIALNDPASVLADVAADRALLEKLSFALEILPGAYKLGYTEALEDAVKIRADRFSGHPDYRPEWKP